MAHQSLYRKYRPQTFPDVVGQEAVTRTLRNAVADSSVAHAYLFCGPRGTGKTTTARILAKALDCEKGPTPDPDDTCESCRQIAEGRHPDVYELDAASRTGVDAVREEIITKVAYAPTHGGWKIYIIDEVHMLSTSAFNALLKTLEEPPPNTVFVLCTTHPHKVPETIHSRCQRFDFRRIGAADIVGRLGWIAEQEGISAEDGVLPLIARHAAGGMRDAIGTLDQLAAFTGKEIALADVEGMLGEVAASRVSALIDFITARDSAACFRFVADLAESGADMSEFVRALTRYARDLYVVAATEGEPGIVDVTGTDLARLSEQGAALGPDRLSRMLDLLGELTAELRWTSDARLALEVALTRTARPRSDMTIEALAERVSALESGAGRSATPVCAPRTAEPPAPARASAPVAPPVQRAGVTETASVETGPVAEATAADLPDRAIHAGTPDVAALRRSWPDVLRELKAVKPAASKAFMDTEVDIEGDTLVVEFGPDRRTPMRAMDSAEVKGLVRDCVERVTGARLAVRYQVGRGAVIHQEAESETPTGIDAEGASAVPDDVAASPDSAVASDADGVSDRGAEAERLLIDGFGARVVSKQPLEDERGNQNG